MKPRKKKPAILRPTEVEDRVSFTCPDCNTVHTFKLLSPFGCVSLSDEDTYSISHQDDYRVLPVLYPAFICTKHRCNFEAVLSLDVVS